ncbi:MAG: hydrolase TatD [Desulfobacterium sp. 4572_20]|nr:MAG: hydrolase TatD [Desulfobacterium sp. 4572_20]HDH87690.1 TatD family deoxyribonuclease [Desulfobacteraceae bacterium]
MLIDSHAHLDMKQFDSDRDQVIDRALSADVRRIITVGIDIKSSRNAVKLTTRYPSIFATAGIHPHNADNANKNDLAQISLIAQQDKIIAIGEIGLDFFRNRSARQKQIEVFTQQLAIAISLDLPVVIHDREAHAETLKILSSFKKNGLHGMIHCFSGDYKLAKTFINMGYYISIPGTVTFKNASQIQDVARNIPLNSLLLETDAPFLTPTPYRGKRNEPSYIIHTAQKIAKLRGVSFEEISSQTSKNVCQLFNLSFPE